MAAPSDETIRTFNFPFLLKPLQQKCIKLVLDGEDVFGVMPTGYGKSIIYSFLPQLFSKILHPLTTTPIVLVVSPLVSLMQDQLVKINTFGTKAVYIGEQHDEEITKSLNAGEIPLLLLSPESLFTGNWRDTLSTTTYYQNVKTIVIDEAHCVEEWGEEFRTDYRRITELRSILPNATMLALTATATKQARERIINMLGMQECKIVTGCSDRPNIMYHCHQASYDIKVTFNWIISELKSLKNGTPKTIIYCRNIKSCSQLFSLLMDELKSAAYLGHPSAKTCLFGMFHHSTPEKNKKLILEHYKDPESVIRVVIATTAFGMGVDVPDIRRVVHWGASRTLNGFMQESGRSGRDDLASDAIVYFHPMDISKTATDDKMHQFCKLTSCRRQFLVNHFSPENIHTAHNLHKCCDNCLKNCQCGECPDSSNSFFINDEDALLMKAVDALDMSEKPFRETTDLHRSRIKELLENLRSTLLEDATYTDASMLKTDLFTGLSDKVIADIVKNAHYIFVIEDILSEYVFDEDTASSVLEIIESVL